jgi:hypothetical protein
VTPADVADFLGRVWPGVVLGAPAVPTTWWFAKLYYNREIRILQQRLEAEQAESGRLRALKDAQHPHEKSATQRQLRTDPEQGPPPISPIPAPRVEAERLAEEAQREKERVRRRTQDVLKAIDHIIAQLKSDLDPNAETNHHRLVNKSAGLKTATKSYDKIREAVHEARDRMLAKASPSTIVTRSPHADSVYDARIDQNSLAAIRADLGHLIVRDGSAEGFF